MRQIDAEDLLHLKKGYDIQELRKSYLKLCLKYHPDKNPDGTEEFKRINEAYHILKENIDNSNSNKSDSMYEEDVSTMSYSEMLKYYYSQICKKYNVDQAKITNIFNSLTSKTKTFTYEFLENLDEETSTELVDLLNKYQYIFGFDHQLFREVREKLKNNSVNKQIITLNPTLFDLFSNNVYILNIDDTKNYVPLWHNEIHFNKAIVYIQPDIPENMELDEDNKLHIHHHVTKEMLFEDVITIQLYPQREIVINCSDLYCRRYQTHILRGIGISKIDDNELFNIEEKNDIIIHIYVNS